ncbi:MAG: hypothetical protein AB7N76_14290 [Planctomycetota bacterium]
MKRAAVLLACALSLPGLAVASDPASVAAAHAELRALLGERMHVPVEAGAAPREVRLRYPLSEQAEVADFEATGFDKCEVGEVYRGGQVAERALELGAGSRRPGRLRHRLTCAGDFELRVRLTVLAAGPSSKLCFLLGDKVGVLWGQRLVRPRGLRALTRQGQLDPKAFGNARVVELRFVRKGEALTVLCDGKQTDQRSFRKGELDDIQIGLAAQNVRVALFDWEVTAQVDEAKLSR